jgi:signal transduction histidine kinase
VTVAAREQGRRVGGMSHRAAARLAWLLCALSLVLTALSLLLLALNLSHPSTYIYDLWFDSTAAAISFALVGALIAARRPENPVGWLMCLFGLAVSIGHFSAEYAIYALLAQPNSLPAGQAMAWIASWSLAIWQGPLLFLFLLFPTGRLPSRRWRSLAWLTGAFVIVDVITCAFSSEAYVGLGPIRNPLGLESFSNLYNVLLFIAPVVYVAVASSLFVRLRRAIGVERQQIKWFVYAAAIILILIILGYNIPSAIDTPFWSELVRLALRIPLAAAIPVSIGIAILRYRLYDIDRIINRTLVYGALSAIVVGAYVLVVGGLGALLQAQGNLLISILAVGLVAIIVEPLRVRLQRGVNRLTYGQRDEPYAVLSDLGRRLESTLAPKEALSAIVEMVVRALKVPYAAIALRRDGEFATAAEHGQPSGELEVLPLVYQSEEVGRLVVAPRTPGEGFAPADRRLLDDLAHQAGAAAHAARLTADLQSSRERLVNAREEERRRLRRDLHDGLGPTLGGLTLGLDAARSVVSGKPSAEELLVRLKEESQEAVDDVRRLVYGLRPPALDDLGLVVAIRQQAAKHGRIAAATGAGRPRSEAGENGPVFSVEASEPLPPLPAAVEVACYRIAQEAMTNVARHAKASSCRVNLSINEATGVLELEVTDDGVGVPEDRRAGVGMNSMRERAEELGGTLTIEPIPQGGTRVLARLPLPAKEE